MKGPRVSSSDTVDITSLVYGKVPPQDRQLEEAILGAIMLEKGAFDIASTLLQHEYFYVDAHQRIFAAMCRLQARSSPIDILTVVAELRKTDELDIVGGPYYVTKLTNAVVGAANIDEHAKIVYQMHMKRSIITAGVEMINGGYEDGADAFDLLDAAEASLFKLSSGANENGPVASREIVVDAINLIEKHRASPSEVTGVRTGFGLLDKVTGGWQPTDLIIIAARPSIGKTCFALNIAAAAAGHLEKPVGVGFFSLEMSKAQLMNRILSCESGVRLERIVRGLITDEEMGLLYQAGKRMSEMPLFIDDSGYMNIFSLRAKARKLVSNHNVGLIVIDYLQLMSGLTEGRNMNREQEVSNISRNLKLLAKELNIPIIALSQLSRAIENRPGGKHQLSDLRESGAIEQDADMVMFLGRGDYCMSEDEKAQAEQEGRPIDTSAQGQIRKHRNGRLEDIDFQTDLSIQKWYDRIDYLAMNGGSPYGAGLPSNFQPPRNFYETDKDQNDIDFDNPMGTDTPLPGRY